MWLVRTWQVLAFAMVRISRPGSSRHLDGAAATPVGPKQQCTQKENGETGLRRRCICRQEVDTTRTILQAEEKG